MVLGTITIASAAPPHIAFYNNSVSNNTLYPHQDINTNIRFNLSADSAIVAWTWIVDGTTASNTSFNINRSWSTPGQKNVTGYGTNAEGNTEVIIWYPIIERPKSDAGDATASLNTSWYDDLLDSMDGTSPDFVAFLSAIILPFTDSMGNVFYVFLYVLPMVLIWIRQEKALIPAGLGIIFGAFFLGFLPESWRGIMILFMILTAFGIVYSLYKERG